MVTGAGGSAGINVISSLKKHHKIVAVDASPYSEGFVLADKYYLIKMAKEEGFLCDLINIVERESIDLVIPTVDEEIDVLSKEDFRHKDKFVLHPKETVEMCLDKYVTYKYLSEKVSEIVPEISTDPSDVSSEIVVKKPRKGRGSRNIEIKKKKEVTKENNFIYVEYLPGREWTVDTLTDRDGNLVVAVPRVRLKTRGGISIIGKVELDKNILNKVKMIVDNVLFTGPINIQFKEDKRGEPKLQEINPRFSGGLDITIAAGANLPKILTDIWLESKYPDEIKIKEGIYVKVWKALEARALNELSDNIHRPGQHNI